MSDTPSSGLSATRQPALIVAVLLWGLGLSVWLLRVYFQHAPEWVHLNHEGYGYVARVLEFRDLLSSGYWSPQWATHFRSGLGSPYFGYYQPGFFYAASAFPWVLAPSRAIGLALVSFSWIGYASMFGMIARWFGAISGFLAANLLILSVYAATDIYMRGDLTEYSAMMLMPACLFGLSGWMVTGQLRFAVVLTFSVAAIVVTHPAISLVGVGVLGLLVLGLLIDSRTRTRAFGGGIALSFGVGLAAFYWLPVALEWELVSPDAAFTGHYDYAGHFLNLVQLVGPYHRDGTIQFTLGPVIPMLLLVNLAWIAWRRDRVEPIQWVVLAIALAVLMGLAFAMNESSAFFWERLRILQKIQFPWRLLTLATVFSAALAGMMLPWPSEKLRGVFVGGVIAISIYLSSGYTVHMKHALFNNPIDVAEIEGRYFAPDARDEWMPKGAHTRARHRLDELPRAGKGAKIDHFERSQGLLRARVQGAEAGFVNLPHYYFPVGWTATLNGESIPMEADRDGLMWIALPAGRAGLLEVRFGRTPMRTAGLGVSAAFLVLGTLLVVVMRRRNSG